MPRRVSAIVGSYDNAAILARAIAAILGQTLPDLEPIVIDDGSADPSPAVALAASASDARVRPSAAPDGSAPARRRTPRFAGGLVPPAISCVTPLALERARRRTLGQAPRAFASVTGASV